jgi:hypothetical protein
MVRDVPCRSSHQMTVETVGEVPLLTFIRSYSDIVGSRLWQAPYPESKCAEAVHVWQAKDQGRHDEGNQTGSNLEESANEGEVVGSSTALCRLCRSLLKIHGYK